MTGAKGKTKLAEVTFSALYKGWVRHRRFQPKGHEFTYPMFMLYLDLDELETVFSRHWYTSINRFNLVSFRREDYFDPETPSLKQAVIEKVRQHFRSGGNACSEITRVRVLTHARYLNIIFNPVSLYYCFDADEQLVAIVAEITNTPWGERHAYVLPVKARPVPDDEDTCALLPERRNPVHHFEFDKAFHVSPFNPMNMAYDWHFSEPRKKLRVHMNNTMAAADGDIEKHFDATLVLNRLPLKKHLTRTLIRFPLMTVNVIVGIYYQAFKLWLKRVPFYDHPKHQNETGPSSGKRLEKRI